MNRQSRQRIAALFEAAMDLATDEQARFLDRECGDDARLRREVERLLAHDPGNDDADAARPLVARPLEPAATLERSTTGDTADAARVALGMSDMEPAWCGISIGAVIHGHRVIERLGEGGMGVVFLARHEDLAQDAVIKVLHRQAMASSADAERRFLIEARMAAAIDHPGVVRVMHVGRHDSGALYILMERLSGESLHSRLTRKPKLEPRTAVGFALQAARALQAVHAVGVHRDLKPDNLFLVPDPDVPGNERVKILDFGIAKLPGQARELTRSHVAMGTPPYMAPEQCLEAATVDGRADLYSMGVVLFEMLCGQRPFRRTSFGAYILAHTTEPPPPVEKYVQVSGALSDLVARLLAKRPEDRPDSARSLVEALLHLPELRQGAASDTVLVSMSDDEPTTPRRVYERAIQTKIARPTGATPARTTPSKARPGGSGHTTPEPPDEPQPTTPEAPAPPEPPDEPQSTMPEAVEVVELPEPGPRASGALSASRVTVAGTGAAGASSAASPAASPGAGGAGGAGGASPGTIGRASGASLTWSGAAWDATGRRPAAMGHTVSTTPGALSVAPGTSFTAEVAAEHRPHNPNQRDTARRVRRTLSAAAVAVLLALLSTWLVPPMVGALIASPPPQAQEPDAGPPQAEPAPDPAATPGTMSEHAPGEQARALRRDLGALFDGGNQDVQREIIHAIVDVGTAEAAWLLGRALEHGSSAIRAAAGHALCTLEWPDSAPKVRKAKRNSGGTLHTQLALALVCLGDRAGVRVLEDALHADGLMRVLAAETLAMTGRDALARPVLTRELEAAVPGSAPWLHAARGLALLGDADARARLTRELARPEPARALAAADILAGSTIGNGTRADAVAAARDDQRRARAYLERVFADEAFADRAEAALLLARHAGADVTADFAGRLLVFAEAALQAGDAHQRRAAAAIIGRMAEHGGARMATVLDTLIDSNDSNDTREPGARAVRITARVALLAVYRALEARNPP